ncbi:MAG: sugar ABC transporter substrate-binding protein [Uliginosibacterium sp.]|nr:sugar ABC transporter substrate-binding protein [Uliginosibacterium sp.]
MMTIRVLFLAAALILGACSNDKQAVSSITQAASSAPAKPDPVAHKARIALVMKTLTNPFFIEMEKGARKAEQENNVELLVKTATQETSIEQQIQIVDEMIAAKVEAIVIAPGDSLRLVPILKKAQDAGIKVINIDNRLDPEALKKNGLAQVPFISVDNERAAYQSAKFIADPIKKPTHVAIFEGIRSADNAQQRKNGALRAFAENKHIRIVAQESANWKIDEARELAKTVFKEHPDIQAVFCANDMMAIGVMEYLREAKHAPVAIAAFDALDEAKRAIKEGQMSVTVDQQAAEQGYQGVMSALRALRGESLPDTIQVDARLVTKESLQ